MPHLGVLSSEQVLSGRRLESRVLSARWWLAVLFGLVGLLPKQALSGCLGNSAFLGSCSTATAVVCSMVVLCCCTCGGDGLSGTIAEARGLFGPTSAAQLQSASGSQGLAPSVAFQLRVHCSHCCQLTRSTPPVGLLWALSQVFCLFRK